MPTFERIQKIELASNAPSVQFTDIPQGYDDLFIIFNVRSTRAGVNADGFGFYLNSTTSGNNSRWGYNVGSTTYNFLASNSSSMSAGNIPSETTVSGAFAPGTIYIPNYTSSFAKTAIVRSAWTNTAAAGQGNHAIAARSPLASAVTSITLLAGSANLLAGSTFSLFGLSSQQTTSSKAGGGYIEKTGGYTYHKFTASNTFTVNESINVQYLIVAGGGGGGAGCCGSGEGEAGGAGAGGMVTGTTTLSPGTYSVVVGAGGSGATINTQLSGSDGSNSSVTGLTAAVGGGGGGGRGTPAGTIDRIGRPGGSGGGSGQRDSFTNYWGAGTAGQGNRGGNGWFSNGVGSPSSGGGGGGGAGGVGSDAVAATIGGNGGIGAVWPTDGTGRYYAGGGGGAAYGYGAASIPGQGGLGGGGNGGWNFPPRNGEAFTGGGGGGGGGDTNGFAGGNGGSGIVVIRYI